MLSGLAVEGTAGLDDDDEDAMGKHLVEDVEDEKGADEEVLDVSNSFKPMTILGNIFS